MRQELPITSDTHLNALSDADLKDAILQLTEQIYNGTYEDAYIESDFVTLSALTSQLKLAYEEQLTRLFKQSEVSS